MEPKSKRRRAGRTVLFAMIVALAAFGIVLSRPQERLLTALAHPVVKVNIQRQHVSWLSDHQFLLLTTDQEASEIRDQNGISTLTKWEGTADLVNADTGARTHPPGLTDLLRRTIVFPMKAPSDFRIFPGGRWLLWENQDEVHGSPPQLAWLDGTHYRTWQSKGNENVFFLDADHLASIREQEPLLILYDLENPRKDRSYRDPALAKTALARGATQRPTFLDVSPATTDGIADTLKIETYRTEESIDGVLQQSGVSTRGSVPLQTRKIPLPPGTTLHWTGTSPQQQAIFYLLRNGRTPPVLAWLHRLVPKFEAKSIPTEELWVSRADGSGMQEIGHVPLPQRPGSDPPFVFADVHWLPDGKRIGFVYNGMLYVAPAEPEK